MLQIFFLNILNREIVESQVDFDNQQFHGLTQQLFYNSLDLI